MADSLAAGCPEHAEGPFFLTRWLEIGWFDKLSTGEDRVTITKLLRR